jgi:hypothetical protein
MLITYFRSSSYNNWDYCQMQYFLNYVLGLPQGANKRAQQGTIVHKVLEVLANCKKVMQPRGLVTEELLDSPIVDYDYSPNDKIKMNFVLGKKFTFEDEHLGLIEWTNEEFLEPNPLQLGEVDRINKTRINKANYAHDAKIPYNTIHYGQDMVDRIFELAYNYYKWDDWAPVDRVTCHNWTWMALEYKDGIFDPRKRTIVEAEPHFEFEIDQPWAQYEWDLPSGEKISGNLAIKGTIDLITTHPGGIMEVVDWKSGARKNWALPDNISRKTYKKLCTDFQLMLYHYAVKRMYPEAKQVIVSIFFIRDGGPYTMCFDDMTLDETLVRLQERFQEIANCTFPAMRDVNQRDFRCTKLCDYYKMTAPNGDNMCKFIHDKIGKIGIEEVTKKYTEDGFSVGYYQEPGQ